MSTSSSALGAKDLSLRAFKVLETKWKKAHELDCSLEKELREKIEKILFRYSSAKTFRYILFTQVLIKVCWKDFDIYALQAKAGDTAIDARSFCKNTVCRFEREFLGNLLGGSSDPYVSKPAREKHLLILKEHIKNRVAFDDLIYVLDKANLSSISAEKILDCILWLLKKKIEEELSPPEWLGKTEIPLGKLEHIVTKFLEETSSLGARPQYIILALLEAFNEITGLYGKIKTGQATEADSVTGRLGDIEILDKEGRLKSVIAITQILSREKFLTEIQKAEQNEVSELMLVVQKIEPDIPSEIETNVFYRIYYIKDYVTQMLWTIDVDIRERFVNKVYQILKEKADLIDLMRWDELVRMFLHPKY